MRTMRRVIVSVCFLCSIGWTLNVIAAQYDPVEETRVVIILGTVVILSLIIFLIIFLNLFRKIRERKRAVLCTHLAPLIFQTILPTLERNLPEGCHVNETACIKALEKIIFDIGSREDKISTQFDKQFQADPEHFISGLKEWRTERRQSFSEMMLNTILPELAHNLPEECSIDKTACIDLLKEIIIKLEDTDIVQSEIPYDQIFKQFGEKFHADPEKFIQGFGKLLDQRAEEIFDQLKTRIILPEHVTLKQSPCVKLIRSLIKSDCDPSKLMEHFVRTIEESPTTYCDILFHTGAPYTGASSPITNFNR